MTNVVDINDKIPHVEGTAMCIICQHEWQAVAPIGARWLECPICHAKRGVFKHVIDLPAGGFTFICKCSGVVFYIAPDGPKCLGCGFKHSWDMLR